MKAGWEIKSLGELCEFQRGLTYAKSDEVAESNVVVLRANNVDLETNTLDLTDLRYIANTIDVPREKRVKKGSLLICTASGSKSHLGKVAFIDDDYAYAFGGFMGQITPKPEMDGRYLFHVMTSPAYKDFIAALSDGANINNLKFNDLRNFQVALPLIAEQRRIVTLLDEAFADIATATANAEKNLQNARDLLESHLQAAFTQQADWELKAFGELAEFRNGINFNKSSKGNEIKIVGVRDFQKNFWAPLDDLETIIPDGEIPATDLIKSGDLLFVRSNGNPELIGRTLLIGDLDERITHSGFTIKARLHHTELSPIYLCHYLKSGLLRREMIEGGNGANIKSLNQGTLSRLKIAFPDKSKQLLIVEHLETVQAEIAELESIYRQKLTALDDLKKSLLHQAFSGQL